MSSTHKHTYELHYFKQMVARPETIRGLLSLGNIPFTVSEYGLLEWGKYKNNFPHGLVPVLTIRDADTNEVFAELTESSAIERYIADMIGHHGDNAVEQAHIDAIRMQIDPVVSTLYAHYWTPAEGKQMRAEAVKKALDTLFRYHEPILAKNGGNGHYVGDRITIADLFATQLKLLAEREGLAELVSEEVAPLFNKVVENTLAEPRLQAYYADVQKRTAEQLEVNWPGQFTPPAFRLPSKN